MHVCRHSHYRQPGAVGAAEPDNLANGVFCGPEFARHGLIDDDSSGCAQRVLLREFPPFQNGNAHTAEVARAGDTVVGAWHVFRVGGTAPFDLKTTAGVSSERRWSNRAGRDHPW